VAVQREDREEMTAETDEFRNSLVAAVQAELERHASAVVAEVDRVRDEGRRERDEMRAEFTSQMAQLAQALERVQARADEQAATTKTQLDQRLADSEARQTRRLDDVTGGLEAMVAEAARPIVNDLRDENEALNRRIESLDANLRRFDEQAARMVTYFNDMTTQMEGRQEELAQSMQDDVKVQLDELKRLVDENDSTVRKFQNEVGQQVSSKLNDAEDRFNNRLLAAENRIKEDSGTKIAEIDLHVSRVSTNLDESLGVMNDRISAVDDRFVETSRTIEELRESVEGIDQDALDDLKEKMSTAAGEAMLVRIEMERLEKGVNERTDSLAVRMTEVETAVQDATMDVSTAVQLDRLEEIERALIEIDPTQFVRKDGADPTVIQPQDPDAPMPVGDAPSGGGDESVEKPAAPADAPDGPDIAAIIAAAESASDHPEED
jgi:hypothetical protein